MKNPAAIAGLLVATIALAIAAVFYGQKESAKEEVLGLEERLAASTAIVDSTRDDASPPPTEENPAELQEVRDELEQALKRIEELETDAAESATETEEAEAEDAEDEEKPKLDYDEILEKIRSNPQAKAQMRAITELTYADLLNSLELDAEAKSTLRDLLVDSQIAQVALTQFTMQEGNVTGRELAGWEQEERDRLAGQVKELLDGEDFEEWEDYAESIDERTIRASLENQIPAFASGLTPENIDLVLEVAVEEFLNEQNAIRQTDEIYTAAEPFLFQLRAMQSMRDRLGPLLGEDQFRELETWIDMAENLMRSTMPEDEETSTDP